MALEIKLIRAKGSLGRVLIILYSIVYYSLNLIQTVNTISTSLWWPDPRRIQVRVVFPLHFQIKNPLESSNPHGVELLMKYLTLSHHENWRLRCYLASSTNFFLIMKAFKHRERRENRWTLISYHLILTQNSIVIDLHSHLLFHTLDYSNINVRHYSDILYLKNIF